MQPVVVQKYFFKLINSNITKTLKINSKFLYYIIANLVGHQHRSQ